MLLCFFHVSEIPVRGEAGGEHHRVDLLMFGPARITLVFGAEQEILDPAAESLMMANLLEPTIPVGLPRHNSGDTLLICSTNTTQLIVSMTW